MKQSTPFHQYFFMTKFLHLNLPSTLFPPCFPTKTLQAFLFHRYFLCAPSSPFTWSPEYYNNIIIIKRKMPPVSCYLLPLSPYYIPLLSNTLSLCSSLNVTRPSSTPKHIKHHAKLQFCILHSYIPRHHTQRPKILYQILWDNKGKQNRHCKHTVTIMHIATAAATSEFESWNNQC